MRCSLCCVWVKQGKCGGTGPRTPLSSAGVCGVTVMQLVRVRTLRQDTVVQKSFRVGDIVVIEGQPALPHKLRVTRIIRQHHGINRKNPLIFDSDVLPQCIVYCKNCSKIHLQLF